MVRHSIVLLLTLYLQAPPSAPPKPSAETGSDTAVIARGWTALASGRYDDAGQAADGVLQRRPWDRAALVLDIHARSAQSAARGLTTYELALTRGLGEDAGLLEPVAIAFVREIAAGPRSELHAAALRALLDARLPGARAALIAARPAGVPPADLDAIAAGAGDPAALGRLNSQASAGGSPTIARALSAVGPAGEPALVLLTQSRDPQTRAAAVETLGAVKTDAAREAVRAVSKDPDPVVRMSSTIALAQMGDEAALLQVERMLASNVPDSQIAAARAWEGKPGPWVEVLRPLLDNQDGVVRLDAARAIAPQDPDAARRVLTSALDDANPVVRYESARVLGETAIPMDARDIGSLRKRLRDPDAAVRLAVASALLRLAR